MSSPYLFLSVIFILVIAFATSTASSVIPYSSANLFTYGYPYEGFATVHDKLEIVPVTVGSTSGSECSKLNGFDGLYCSPSSAGKMLDVFSDADSGLTCSGSGLSNSKGSLCLTPAHQALLSTRGGNTMGIPAEIGN